MTVGSSTSEEILMYFELSNFFFTAVSVRLEAVMHSLATLLARSSQMSMR